MRQIYRLKRYWYLPNMRWAIYRGHWMRLGLEEMCQWMYEQESRRTGENNVKAELEHCYSTFLYAGPIPLHLEKEHSQLFEILIEVESLNV